ncbi:hypothetical protein CLAFUW4_04425 [Fulvia fulva]|uniref:Transcription initiation factor TFIID subunit 8 n=1 Tax=Passalora fulva TaxID=5499 RepID=A0A9Q8LFK3_PASFU|nr:uncharacterized protein CLAFUR5_04388 [Fulvia fulva]KAK4626721.1 hypothetical protein CLAFUR4_04411 [Fulvia fulva]KAK4627768.1 hypothetical protein CLAFUR0_04413 [Fulvia fulva]UJO16511.1 hypothetical protein CLAFUR5_04388 [Fulvia fulva]WPV13522.1 hypothetical protein CLAFUW4_04425 [Fulvia fulva]WPV29212.1 hypothetical protein CLAFUW7_04415 [Fulvia fulva]
MAPDHSPSTAHAGTKRPHSASPQEEHIPTKRQRVHHKLRHVQKRPNNVEPAPQDPVFAQGQLLKSISAALVMAGFDSVKPSALEMFRSHVEEYMLHFLADARTSMFDGRRTTPIALDFASALARNDATHTASLLKPQLELQIPEDISCPTIAEPDPAPPPAPDFSSLLQPLMTPNPPAYIPRHFPPLPPQHAWKKTPVFPNRETDSRKMREKATAEGMLAEQALRKLAAAAKTGALNAEKRRGSVLSGAGKAREAPVPQKAKKRPHEDTFAEVLKDIGGLDESVDLAGEGVGAGDKDDVDLGMPEGVVVNHNMTHWRKHGHRKTTRG